MIFPNHREAPSVLPDGLPAAVARIARVLPAVAALAVLTGRDSPRWAYGSWAVDLVGPLRSQPRMPPEDHERVQKAVTEVSTLTDLVSYLDSLAGVQTAPERPEDAPASLLASRALRWPVLRCEVYAFSGEPVLAGLPRAMPPSLRGDGSPAALDARVAAVAALVRAASDRGPVEYETVFCLIAWSVGYRRADCGSATRTGQHFQPGEHASFAVSEAARLLAAGDPVRVTGDLLAAVRDRSLSQPVRGSQSVS